MDVERSDPVAAASDALQEELLGSAPLGMAVLDRELRFLYANAALAVLDGVPAEAHAGRTPRELLGDAADVLEPVLARGLAGESVLDHEVREPGGAQRPWRLSVLPLRGGDALGLLATRGALGVPGPAGAALQRAEERLRLALDATGLGTWEWDIAEDRLRWSPAVGPMHGLERGAAPASYEDFLTHIHPDDRAALAAEIATAVEHGAGFDRELRVVLPDGGIRWLHTRAHVIGGGDGRPGTLVGVSTDVTDRKRREQASELLAEASLVLAQSLDPVGLLQQVVDLAVPTLADWCTAHLVGEEDRPARVAVAHGDPERLAGALELERRYAPHEDSDTGPRAVVRSGRAQLVRRIPDELLEATAVDAEHLRLMRELQLRSALIVPIAARGRTLGAITFIHAESGREYDEEDLETAAHLGRRAGLAIDNAMLLNAERDAREQLEALQSVTDVSLSHLDREGLLRESLTRLCEVTGADEAAVLLLREADQELELVSVVGLDRGLALRVPFGRGIAGRIAAEDRPLVLDDLADAGAVSMHLQEPGRALAGVPLRAEGAVIGVLHVSSRERRFGAADVRLLELVADRAALALRQAELYGRARDTALALQRSLLPSLPSVAELDVSARYLPGQAGTEVGGDWYDLFLLPDGRVAIVVGDVVGRGLRAAAIMGQLRTALRAYAFEAPGPAAAVGRLDRLTADPETLEFATLAVVFLDATTGSARMCSAGHLPPLLVAPDGRAATAAVPSGPPVGVARGPREEVTIRLQPDASIVLYTDGLVEDRRRGLTEGLERLAAAAGPGAGDAGALVDRLLAAMSEDRELEDDVALIAVRLGGGLQRSFPAQPPAVPVARRAVTAYAESLGAPPAVLQDVALAVSEACTNVVVHAYRDREPGMLHVAAHRDGACLRVVVADEGSGLQPRGDSPGVGLGLQIIARTTKQFEVEQSQGGGARLVLRFPLEKPQP